MIEDIRTMLWKEWKELLMQGGNNRFGRAGLLIVLVPAFVFPIQLGREWVTTPVALTTLLLVPLLVANTIADSVAGERERHTLDTLLASRLPDNAILFGKIMASTLFAWGESLLYLVPGLVIVNLRFAGEGLAVYPLSVWLGMLVGCPLLALLFASSGVIVSLRSATVRQAQLILSLFFFVPAFLPMFLTLLPRDVARRLLDDLRTWDITLLILIVSALLLALDIAVTRLAMQRFRRTRLVLDG